MTHLKLKLQSITYSVFYAIDTHLLNKQYNTYTRGTKKTFSDTCSIYRIHHKWH